MSKPVLGLLLGAILGVFDGLSALLSAPETQPQLMAILIGSSGKGLVAGLIIGFFAKKVSHVAAGIIFGIAVSALITLPIAIAPQPTNDNQPYFWEIMIPGAIVGLIVGFATQRYGARASARA
jgi:uncharacterized membrane protein (Fun14 family)